MTERGSCFKPSYQRKSSIQGKYSTDRPLSTDKVNFHSRGIYSHSNFVKYALKKDVAIERAFDNDYLQEIQFRHYDLLKKYGWLDFITNQDYDCKTNLVRAFYFNGDKQLGVNKGPEYDDRFLTNVCGVDILVTPALIREILGETYSDGRSYVYEDDDERTVEDTRTAYEKPGLIAYKMRAPSMGMDNRILHLMVCQVLQVRKGSYTVSTMHDLWWMARILRDDPPDLCTSIFIKIRDALDNAHNHSGNNKDSSFPYGKLITRLIEKKLENRLHKDEITSNGMGTFNSVGMMGWIVDPITLERKRKHPADSEDEDDAAPNAQQDLNMVELRGMFAQNQAMHTESRDMLLEMQRRLQVQEAQNMHHFHSIQALQRNESYNDPFPSYASLFPPPPSTS